MLSVKITFFLSKKYSLEINSCAYFPLNFTLEYFQLLWGLCYNSWVEVEDEGGEGLDVQVLLALLRLLALPAGIL